MSLKKVLLLVLSFFSVGLSLPKASQAISLPESLTSENSLLVKIQERLEYFFAFNTEKKVQVLDRQAEKRLSLAEVYAGNGNTDRLQSVMQNYLQLKVRQNNLLGQADMASVLGAVEDRTLDQQKTMENVKTMVGEDSRQQVNRIQEQVVNQVAQRIVEVNGPEGQTEFFTKVEHVWAPGTGPGGESGTTFAPGTSGVGNAGVTVEGGLIQFAPGTSAGGVGGVVIKGGASGQFAPGTSAGGTSGADIKTVEVKTGGVEGNGNNVVENNNPINNQPADPGKNDTRVWIDP